MVVWHKDIYSNYCQYKMKPHIYKSNYCHGMWICKSENLLRMHKTPREAYDSWRKAMLKGLMIDLIKSVP